MNFYEKHHIALENNRTHYYSKWVRITFEKKFLLQHFTFNSLVIHDVNYLKFYENDYLVFKIFNKTLTSKTKSFNSLIYNMNKELNLYQYLDYNLSD